MKRRNLEALLPFLFVGLMIAARFAFPNKMTFLTEVSLFTLYIMGNNILFGYMGYVSFGQPIYLSMGAYSAALYLAYLGRSPLAAILVAILFGVVVGLVMGPVLLRLRGSYFTLVNAAFCAIGVFTVEKLLIGVTNGNDGLWFRARMVPPPLLDIRLPQNFFFFAMLVLLVVFLLYRRMDRSALGAAFRATQANERRMRFLGYNTLRIRWIGFTLATVLSTLAGSLYAINLGFVNPSLGENSRAAEVIVATLIGGSGTVFGPFFGALGFLGIKEIVSEWITRWELVVGVLTLIVLFRFNQGIWGSVMTLLPGGRRRRKAAALTPADPQAKELRP